MFGRVNEVSSMHRAHDQCISVHVPDESFDISKYLFVNLVQARTKAAATDASILQTIFDRLQNVVDYRTDCDDHSSKCYRSKVEPEKY